MVHFLLSSRRIGRQYHQLFLVVRLHNDALLALVALGLESHKVLAVEPLVAQLLLERM